jgi:hypothetical protein
MPPRDKVQDTKAAQEMMQRAVTGLDVVKALAKRGFTEIANNILGIQKQQVSGDCTPRPSWMPILTSLRWLTTSTITWGLAPAIAWAVNAGKKWPTSGKP